jgi:hypothetical protein
MSRESFLSQRVRLFALVAARSLGTPLGAALAQGAGNTAAVPSKASVSALALRVANADTPPEYLPSSVFRKPLE